jgi:glucose 1-dehydrogenase
MCSNGGYTERGIKQVDGFMADRWRIEPENAVKVDRRLGSLGVLLEPATVVTKGGSASPRSVPRGRACSTGSS